MKGLLALSNAINTVLRTIAFAGSWFALACIVTICFDVLTRKFGFQLSIGGIDLGSTRLQELEWHFHAMLFLTWIGYAYVKDSHVRIDIVDGQPAGAQAGLARAVRLHRVRAALSAWWRFPTRTPSS